MLAWSIPLRTTQRPWRTARVSGPSTNANVPASVSAVAGADESEPRSDLESSERSARLMSTSERCRADGVAAELRGCACSSDHRCVIVLALPDDGGDEMSTGSRRSVCSASECRSFVVAGVGTNGSGFGPVVDGSALAAAGVRAVGESDGYEVEGMKPSRKSR